MGTARATSGRELALAIANATAQSGSNVVILIAAAEVDLTGLDWAGIPLPLVLPTERSLTIRGSPDLPTGPPILRMPTLPALQLLSDTTLIFEDLVLDYYVLQKMSFFRTPSLSILLASPEGTRGALVVGHGIAAINAFCLPAENWEQSTGAAARPALYPGVQRFHSNIDQGDCVNDTSAPPLQRCWVARYLDIDVAAAGAQLNPSGNPVPTNYDFQLLNVTVLCPIVLDRSCVASLGPLGCMLLYERGVAGAFLPGGASAAPPTAGAQAAGGGGGLSPLATGCIVGGVVLIIVLVAVAVFLLRGRRTKHSHNTVPSKYLHEPERECAKSGSLESGTTRTATDTAEEQCGKEADGSAHGTASFPGEVCVQVLSGAGSTLPAESRLARAVVVSDLTPLAPVVMVLKVHGQVDMQPNVDGMVPLPDGSCPGGASSASRLPTGRVPGEPDHVVRLTGVVLGKGAFGRVYEGTYQGRLVAVKQLLEGPGDAAPAGAYKALEAYQQELEVLGRCDHPNIVKVLAACVVDTARPVMVLERMDTSLDKMLYGSPGTLLPLRLVLHIATQVALGLSYLHPTILHRDLKPANVLVSNPHGEAPVVKLSDFGLSRLRHSVLRTGRPEAGTPAYMSPECFDLSCDAITHRTDCYSFGVLLWEMLAGTHPWFGIPAVRIAYEVALLNRRLPIPPLTAPGGGDAERWPPRLRALLTACFERDPWRRPAAAEAAKALTLALEAPAPVLPAALNRSLPLPQDLGRPRLHGPAPSGPPLRPCSAP